MQRRQSATMTQSPFDMKICFKCGDTLPVSEFYKHPRMKDGHLNKCKKCARSDVSANYNKRRSHYQKYERARLQRPERKAQAQKYQIKRRELYPEKYIARNKVANALRDGRIERKACEKCGVLITQAHHDDYRKPLEVRWLCFDHHRQEHGQLLYQKNMHLLDDLRAVTE